MMKNYDAGERPDSNVKLTSHNAKLPIYSLARTLRCNGMISGTSVCDLIEIKVVDSRDGCKIHLHISK